MHDRTRYSGTPMTANSTITLTGISVGGFLPVTAGTITITTATGRVLVNAYPLSAGVFAEIPLFVGNNGATVALAGGASGTLLV